MNAPALVHADSSRLAGVIASLAGQLSGAGDRVLDVDIPFAELGLDSLGTVELAALLEDELGIDVPLDFVADCADARTLAERLAEPCSQSRNCDLRTLFEQDALLPADVRPPAAGVRRDAHNREGLLEARRILLTGATGFLGGWLAAELLAQSQATLTCLVRPDGKSAEDRLRKSLRLRGVDIECTAARVSVLEGDLSLPLLGLSPVAFHRVAREVDAVCHAGAVVNWVQSYRTLRAANVMGTRELLRLASIHGRPFHFVSSLSVCYSTVGPGHLDERFVPLPHVEGVHLGYAQTKVVAEALVSAAARRGLPVTIYRPSLISGHSTTGDFNGDDLLSLLVKGCVRMGCAPDLDWTLDALPVDVVAHHMLCLSSSGGTFHLAHRRPRHWRECVLWMRLYGYPLTLLPYRAWLERLELDLADARKAGDRHPLQPLERLLFGTPARADGLTIPELYEETRRSKATCDYTARKLGHTSSCPDLDASLLDRYFDAFIAAGHLGPPHVRNTKSRPKGRSTFDAGFFSRALRHRPDLEVVGATLLESGSSESILSELTAWQSAGPTGVFRYALELDDQRGLRTREVILKVKARDTDAIAVGEALSALCGDRTGAAYRRWRNRLGMSGSHLRELAIYKQTDERFTRHTPSLLGSVEDEDAGVWALVLERISNATEIPNAWDPDSIDAAISGLSALQSIWYNRGAELSAQPWIGWIQSASSAAEMRDLWVALAHHAEPCFSVWSGPSLPSIHQTLIDRIGQWWRVLEHQPQTLIHNDFNPRNICVRPRASGALCAYDWELATRGAPQRDLAELLCFVLAATATDADIDQWVERHRSALEAETGDSIDPLEWREGFAAALYDFLVSRLSFYALINRVRPQPFLPRVVHTWGRLYERFPLREDTSW